MTSLAQAGKPSAPEGINNRFPAVLGILSAAAFPLYFRVWGSAPLTTTLYVEAIILVGGSFLLLSLAGNCLDRRWPLALQDFDSVYVSVVIPGLWIGSVLLMTAQVSAAGFLLGLLVLHVAAGLLWFFGKRIIGSTRFKNLNVHVIHLLPIGYSLLFWIWLSRTYDLSLAGSSALLGRLISIGILLSLSVLSILNLHRSAAGIRFRWVLGGIVILILVGLVYRPDLYVDRHHYNFYLAPLNDVLHGKVLFVNSTSQYGIAVIYALALVFRSFQLPVGYYGLSLILSGLFFLQ